MFRARTFLDIERERDSDIWADSSKQNSVIGKEISDPQGSFSSSFIQYEYSTLQLNRHLLMAGMAYSRSTRQV